MTTIGHRDTATARRLSDNCWQEAAKFLQDQPQEARIYLHTGLESATVTEQAPRLFEALAKNPKTAAWVLNLASLAWLELHVRSMEAEDPEAVYNVEPEQPAVTSNTPPVPDGGPVHPMTVKTWKTLEERVKAELPNEKLRKAAIMRLCTAPIPQIQADLVKHGIDDTFVCLALAALTQVSLNLGDNLDTM